MNVYLIAGIAALAGVLMTLAINFLFFSVGKSDGSATAKLDTAQTDLSATKRADVIVNTEVSDDALDKSLRNGTF